MAQFAAQVVDLATGADLVDVVGMGSTWDEAMAALKVNIQADWNSAAPDAGQRVLDAWWDDLVEGNDTSIGIRPIEFPE